MLNYPPGTYSNYDPATKSWTGVAFNSAKHVQSAELNDLQRIISKNSEDNTSKLFNEGQFYNGGKITTTPNDDGVLVNITSGSVYALGFWHDMPASELLITGIGREVVSLKLTTGIIDATMDPDLNNPASGSEAYGTPAANRTYFVKEYVVNDPNATPIATFQDGQLVIPPVTNNGWLDQFLDILALRTREQSGSFLTARPKVSVEDPADATSLHINLYAASGVGYIRGTRRENTQARLTIVRPFDGADVRSESKTFLTANRTYEMSHKPVRSVSKVVAFLQSPTIVMTRGGTVNGTDGIPAQYTPTANIVSITQGGTTYVNGTDFVLASNYVSWLPGGIAQPATGTSYNLVVQYTKNLTQGVRTQTSVVNESVVKSGSTNTLAHADVMAISKITDSAGTTTYVEGTHYTYVKNTGVITWIGLANATYKVSYVYWAHTIEGDFVARNSFVTDLGNGLPELTPVKTPSGDTVDYKKNISFDTTGTHPVNNTPILVDYQYTLSRTDVLVWREDGPLEIIPGIPAEFPVVPVLSDNQMPVAKIKMTPEAKAADVQFENYNNLTLLVTELRDMWKTVSDIQFNLAQFELESNLANQPTVTNKIGIFADKLDTPDKIDLTNIDQAGTLDFLARNFLLPRTTYISTPVLSSSDASVKEGVWVPSYTEQATLVQPFRSEARAINKYGAVNKRAKLILDKNYDGNFNGTAVTITSYLDTFGGVNFNWPDLANPFLNMTIAPNGPVAARLGQATSSTNDPWYYTRVLVNNAWTDVITDSSGNNPLAGTPSGTTTTTVIDGWATITKSTAVMTAVDLGLAGTIRIDGSLFIPNEAGIVALFNGKPTKLVPISPTVAETDPLFPNSVKADNSGNWSANMLVPAGAIQNGQNRIEVFGHDPDDLTRVVSTATSTYSNVANLEHIDLVIHKTTNWHAYAAFWVGNVAAFGLTLGLDWGTSQTEILPYQTVSLAHLIAAGIASCVKRGITVTRPNLLTATALMISYSSMESFVNGDIINTLVNAPSLTSSDVAANAKLIQNAHPYGSLIPTNYIALAAYDPLAETFSYADDAQITSCGIYLNVLPVEPIHVAIATVEAGVPTKEYIGFASLDSSEIAAHTTGGETKFTFDRPVTVKGGVSYAIVVLTEDTAASIWTAVLGQKDQTGALITKNPAAGVALESANAESWQVLSATDLQFKLYTATYTNSTATLTMPTQTFPGDICGFSMNLPWLDQGLGTDVQFQYSLNNADWRNFQPLVEVELGGAYTTVYFRVIMNCAGNLAPIALKNAQILGYLYKSTGAYVARQFVLPTQSARYFDAYIDVNTSAGGTSVLPKLKLDNGAYVTMTEVTADAIAIDDVWVQKHYTYDAGVGNLKQSVRLKIELSTSVTYSTSKIRKPRLICR